MFGFAYTYKTTPEILDSVTRVVDFSPIEIIALIVVIIGVAACILYLFPLLISINNRRKKENGKKKRKKLLTQISMQKEIEDEIAAEIESTNQ